MDIRAKNLLITGGAVRVGAQLAETLAKSGANVIIHYRNSRQEAETLANKIPGAKLIYADLAEKSEALELLNACGKVDILINNASIFDRNSLLEETPEEVEKNFQVNFLSPLILMQQFIRQELAEGVIINILDNEVMKKIPQFGSYSLSKRALKEATLKMAQLAAPKNIRVNAIAPGPMLPPVFLPASKMEKSIQQLPLKHAVHLADFNAAVRFLIANDSITGEIITLDCGGNLI